MESSQRRGRCASRHEKNHPHRHRRPHLPRRPEKAKEPDNSGKNERDKSGATVARRPINAPADVKMTQDIRRNGHGRQIANHDGQNVKIITIAGSSPARPVNSAAEKEAICITRSWSPEAVTDELEIKATK
jgi:hypothetical protein